MDPSLQVFIIVLSLFLCAFFSGMEIAFLSSNRLKVELDRSKGTLNGRIMGLFYKRESFFIALLLLGNTTTLVFFGIYTALMFEPMIREWGVSAPLFILFIQTIMSSLIVLFLAEFLPKALVQINPNGFLRVATSPMLVIYILLFVPTQLVMFVSGLFLKMVRSDKASSAKVFSKIDLEHYVQDLSARIKDEEELGNEMQILQNALDFTHVKARDCMIPRTDIIAVEVDDEIDVLKALFIEKGLSKILVYRDTVDNVIGYVHSHEMFKKPTSIKQILLPISYVPSAIAGNELLQLFSKQSGNIAVVVDEYGGTAGLVTIEDVLEEIFGEIEDEHDVEEWLEEQISDTEFRFSARIEIDYLNETYHLGLSESEDYDTLGGLIIHALETIPDAGTSFNLDQFSFLIEEVSDRRIEIVRVSLM